MQSVGMFSKVLSSRTGIIVPISQMALPGSLDACLTGSQNSTRELQRAMSQISQSLFGKHAAILAV